MIRNQMNSQLVQYFVEAEINWIRSISVNIVFLFIEESQQFLMSSFLVTVSTLYRLGIIYSIDVWQIQDTIRIMIQKIPSMFIFVVIYIDYSTYSGFHRKVCIFNQFLCSNLLNCTAVQKHIFNYHVCRLAEFTETSINFSEL